MTIDLSRIISVETLLMIAFAVLYYGIANVEGGSKTLWVSLSLLVSLVCRWLTLGMFGMICTQALLFVAISVISYFLPTKD